MNPIPPRILSRIVSRILRGDLPWAGTAPGTPPPPSGWDWLTSLPSALAIYDSAYTKAVAVTSSLHDRASSPTDSPLTQGTDSARPTWNDADAQFGNKPSQSFGGDDFLSAATPADFNICHNGAGCSIHCIFRSDSTNTQQILFDNGNVSGATRGMFARFDGTGQTIRCGVGNGATLICDSGTVACSRGAAHILSWRYKEGSSPEWSLHLDGVLLNSGASTGAPSASDASGVLRMGRRSTSADQFLVGKVAVLGIYSDYHSDAQIAEAVAAAKAGWGVP